MEYNHEYDNHSEIDSLNAKEMQEAYNKYLLSKKDELSDEEYNALRALLAQNEAEFLFDDDTDI